MQSGLAGLTLVLLGLAGPISGAQASEPPFTIHDSARQHWAFQSVQRPPLPAVDQSSWVQDDLDRFILAGLERNQLSPAPQADRRTLMRRLSFALTGLPPTPDQLKEFLQDRKDASLESYVDSLMESEAFGEHWARHWLDHVRYRPFPGKGLHNDPYRLWVMKAFNEDMPFTRFVQMQIAGDLLPGPNPDKEIHLDGMVAVRPFSLKSRHPDQLDLLGRTFMGMSLFCARCHDHKHEPLSRKDYFALQGLYKSSQVIKAPYLRDKQRYSEFMDGLTRKQANEMRMKKELKEFGRVSQLMDLRERLAAERKKLDDPKQAKNRSKIEKNIEKMLKDEKKRLAEIDKREIKLDAPEALEYIKLNKENKAFDQKWKEVYQFDAFVDQNDPNEILDAAPPQLGIKTKPGQDPPRENPVPRRFPAVLAGENQKPLGERTEQSGRLELARWLGNYDHPITTRLMVNRIWYYLMGEGLVPSLSNFGLSGRPPSHPALLDYLSDELEQSGGSMKSLIRRIVLSSTFQQVSGMELKRDERDQRLVLFGLARGKRLEAESIWRTLNRLEYSLQPKERHRDPPIDIIREIDDLFDGADSSLIVPKRTASVTSLQALYFMNSDHVRNSTEKLAVRLHAIPNDSDRITQIFQMLYSREPTDSEIQSGKAFLTQWVSTPATEDRRRKKDDPPPEFLSKWQAYVQVLLAANEFLFID